MATEADSRGHAGREFFTTRTVAEALTGFRPARRPAAQAIPLSEALRRVPASPVTAPHPLPGFARSTVDGYAVRAADTYGVSEGLPGYLTVTGAVLMGTEPDTNVAPGTAVAMPTGGPLPPGADAVVMVEYTAEAMPGTIEVVRPVAPGEGVGRADEGASAVARLGEPGIWCHGLAIKPGKPTLLAECASVPGEPGVPVIGLPGNPRSALVVFRLIGMPLARLVGGCTVPPPEASTRARLARDLASATGRLDVVQVTVRAGVATPLFGVSALLSVLTAADGSVVTPEEATGLD